MSTQIKGDVMESNPVAVKITKNAELLKYIALLFLVISIALGLFYCVYLITLRFVFMGILTLAGSSIIGVLGFISIKIFSETLVTLSFMLDNTTQIRELLIDIRDGTKNFYKEKRKSTRLFHAVSVNYSIGGSQKPVLTKTKNIGEHGCFLKTQENIARGEILNLEIFLPTFPKPIAASAEAVFVADQKSHPNLYPGVGVKYLDIKKEDQLKIREYIYTQTRRR